MNALSDIKRLEMEIMALKHRNNNLSVENMKLEIQNKRMIDSLKHEKAERQMLQEILDNRPAINAALPESYIAWSHAIYAGDVTRAYVRRGNAND